MESNSLKFYHLHEFDTKFVLENYFSPTADEEVINEIIVFTIEQLIKVSGQIKGGTLIDISAGPVFFHILPICNLFKDIVVLEFNEGCMKDMQKWINRDKGAFDWSYTSKMAAKLKGNSSKWEEMEEDLRKQISRILKCDFTKENPTDPVKLERADCVLNMYAMGFVSQDQETYCKYLKKMSAMLKLGGQLLMFGGINACYFIVANNKFHTLKFDETFLRKALAEAGFTINTLEMIRSKMKNHIANCEIKWFINAQKSREN